MNAQKLGGCWPTPDQTLLLRAAVLDEESARTAFDVWRARVDVDRLDYGSARLLPFVYLNLRDLNHADPPVRAMRERYERTSTDNERRVVTLASVIGRLRDAGIDTLVLKGMALVATGILPPGARPMDDLDLLVPGAQALAARDELLADGWRLLNPIARAVCPSVTRLIVGTVRRPSGSALARLRRMLRAERRRGFLARR